MLLAHDPSARRRQSLRVLRLAIVAAQAATIAVTWPLWQARVEPPLLPVADLPSWSFGVPLLLTLALALRWPTLGAAMHTLALAVAMAFDQTREQPQVVSLAVLLWAATPLSTAAAFGALHLAALWFWSGLGKLTSPRFLADGGTWLLGGEEPSTLGASFAIALGVAEVLLAVAAIVPRWRPLAARAGMGMHLGIFVFLSPLGRDTNASVWPWNLALAIAAPILLRAPREPSPTPAGTRLLRTAAACFVLLPLGFHAGFVDAPFAMQVYTLNEPRAVVLRANGAMERIVFLPGLGVPLPHVPRIQAAWFARAGPGRRGDRIVLLETRPLARALGCGDQLLSSSR